MLKANQEPEYLPGLMSVLNYNSLYCNCENSVLFVLCEKYTTALKSRQADRIKLLS